MDSLTADPLALVAGALCAATSLVVGLVVAAVLWKRGAARAVAVGLGLATPGPVVLLVVVVMGLLSKPPPDPAGAAARPVEVGAPGSCVAVSTLPDGALVQTEVIGGVYKTDGDTLPHAAFSIQGKEFRGDLRGLSVIGAADLRAQGLRSRLVLTVGDLSGHRILGAMLLHEDAGRWCVTDTSPAIAAGWGEGWSVGEVIPLDSSTDGIVVTEVAFDGDVAEEALLVIAGLPGGSWVAYRDQSRLLACSEEGCTGHGAAIVTRPGPDGEVEVYRRPWTQDFGEESTPEPEERLVWKDGGFQVVSTSGALPVVGATDGTWELSADRARELGVPAGTWTASWLALSEPNHGRILALLSSTAPGAHDVVVGAAVLKEADHGSWALLSKDAALFAVPDWGGPEVVPGWPPASTLEDLDMWANTPGPLIPVDWARTLGKVSGDPERPADRETRVTLVGEVDGKATVLLDLALGVLVGPDSVATRRSVVWYEDERSPTVAAAWPALVVATCAYDPWAEPARAPRPVEVTVHRPLKPVEATERWTLPSSAEILTNAEGAACAAPAGALASPVACVRWADNTGAHLGLLSAEKQPVRTYPAGSGIAQDLNVRVEVWDLDGEAPVRSWAADPRTLTCEDAEVRAVRPYRSVRTDIDSDGTAEVNFGVSVECDDGQSDAALLVVEGAEWTDGAQQVSPALKELRSMMGRLVPVQCPAPRPDE